MLGIDAADVSSSNHKKSLNNLHGVKGGGVKGLCFCIVLKKKI